MQKGTRRLEQLTFKMLAVGPNGNLYGLTNRGKVFAWHQSQRYWVPMGMGTPKPILNVEDTKENVMRTVPSRPRDPTGEVAGLGKETRHA